MILRELIRRLIQKWCAIYELPEDHGWFHLNRVVEWGQKVLQSSCVCIRRSFKFLP